MKRYLGTALVGIVCFVLCVAFQRYSDARRVPAQPPADSTVAAKPEPPAPVIQYDREPLWAYGFETVAKADDKAPPQAAPTRNLRPNEDSEEQTRARQARGSRASYSLVDVRDGHNVIDWFPQDHPSPMPPIIKTGPAAGTGNTGRGCGSCHLPNGKGRPENAPPAGLPVAYFMRQLQDFKHGLRRSADPRKPNTNTMIELAKVMTRRDAAVGGILRGDQVDPVDPRDRKRPGSEDPHRRQLVPADRAGANRTDCGPHHRTAGGCRAGRDTAKSAIGIHCVRRPGS